MIENGRVLTGCDTCDYSIYDANLNCRTCGSGLEQTGDGCPKYKMSYPCFFQNHAQYDKYTGLAKNLKFGL